MTDATHFIEQYKDKDGDSIMCLVTPISKLPTHAKRWDGL